MSLQQDIDRGLEIVREIARLETELKEIKSRVDAAALKGHQVPLEDPERDGMQFLANGSAEIVPVVITADYLAKSFTQGSEKHEEVLVSLGAKGVADVAATAAAAKRLLDFYPAKIVHERTIEDGKKFRQQARLILGGRAEKFIAACVSRDRFGVPKSAVKIEWERAKEKAEVAA